MSRRPALVCLLVFVVLLPAVTARLGSDEIQFFAWLRSATFDGDADFENEYRHFHDLAPDKHVGFRQTFLEVTNEAGRRPNFAPIGSAILWAPFYGIGHLVAIVTGAPVDGFSGPYISAVAYGSAVYGVLALVLTLDITRRLLSRSGLGAALALWFGTPLVFYMYIAPGFAHATSAFAVSLFVWTWLRVRTSWSLPGVVALGAVAGLLPMVREQDAFFLAGPTIDFLRWAWRTRTAANGPVTAIARATAGITAAAVAYLPQLWAYQALNGHPGPTTLVTRKLAWSSPHFFDVVLSPEHGLFFWTPLALLGVAGLVRMAWGQRSQTDTDVAWVASLLLVMVVLQIYVSGAVLSWSVAGSFGQRRFVALTPLLAVGLAALVPPGSARWRGLTLGLAVTLCVWWNLGLMAQFGLNEMDRQRLTLGTNARRTFLDLPLRAPGLAWRYLVDRESLLRPPRP